MNLKLKVFIEYILTSLASSAIDIAFFYIFLKELDKLGLHEAVFLSTILARIISCIISYILNKKIVFKSDGKISKQLSKHIILTVAQMLLSASLIYFVNVLFKANEVIEKMVVDSILFFVFYFAQKLWVFKDEQID